MKKHQHGFTIVETLTAALLLGLAIWFMTPMLTWSLKSSQLNKERSAATQAAQRILEEVQNGGFTSASAIVSRNNPQTVMPDDLQGNKLYIREFDGQISTTPKSGFKLLQVQRIYTFIENSPQSLADDLIQVTVKINWPGSQGYNITMGIALPRNGVS